MENGTKIPHTLEPQALQSKRVRKIKRKAWMKTEEYTSHGSRYCRFRWGNGSTTHGYAHINGGAADSPLVCERRREIDRMVAQRRSVSEILAAIGAHPGARRGRKAF